MKKYVFVFTMLAVLFTVVIAGCGQSKVAGISGEYVAEINGEKISSTDFVNYLRIQAGVPVLAQMLEDKLILDLAKKQGVSPTDEQIQKRIDVTANAETLKKMLAERGWSMDDLKNQIKIVQARANIALKYVGKDIKDDEIKKAYETEKATSYDVPEKRKTEFVAFLNEKAARDAYEKIKKGATLESIGRDTSSQDHGPFITNDVPKSGPDTPPEVSKAVFETPIGKVSEPVSFQGGAGQQLWIIVKPTDEIPAFKVSFDKAKDVVKGNLAMKLAAGNDDYRKLMDDARAKAKIIINESLLKPAEKSFRDKQ